MAALAGYLGLGSIDPATGIFTEFSDSGYARKPIAFDGPTNRQSGDFYTLRNTAAATFATAVAYALRPFNAYGFYTAKTGATGIFFTALKHLLQGPTPSNALLASTIAVGDLGLDLDVVANGRVASLLGGVIYMPVASSLYRDLTTGNVYYVAGDGTRTLLGGTLPTS